VSRAVRRRGYAEPLGLFVVALVGSAAMWGRLWVTAPGSKGVCGCGDPSLFQWFLAWPEHALATGHSLVFSRDLFFPHGVNLLANTSVLALGLPLSPITWLGGPVLTENVALLLAAPVAAWTMDLLLRRVTGTVAVRIVLSLLFGFSPYVVASLAVSHLMTAWIGILPLIVLGGIDAVSEDARRARKGQLLLVLAVVVQFFVSTELLLLAAMVGALALAITAASWLIGRQVPPEVLRAARRLALPGAAAVIVLAAPTYYALLGPRSLKGNIWGPQFNPVTGGTAWQDLVRPSVVDAKLTIISGYHHEVVQLQYLGWGLLAVSGLLAAWQWRDRVVRLVALTSLVCLVLSLSPKSISWAPWQWLGTLPVLQNVLQFRIVVFALGGCILVLARGLAAVQSSQWRGGPAVAIGALALAVIPTAVPVAESLPIRTDTIAVPSWWRSAPSHGVVLSYPLPSLAIQSPLTWQAVGGYSVRLLGGSGPQGDLWRAGADEGATSVLDDLSNPLWPYPPIATASNAASIRAMVARDGVTEVVVPIVVHGSPLAVGAPSSAAVVFLAEVLGAAPDIVRGAWVFDVAHGVGAPRLLGRPGTIRCKAVARATPSAVGACVLGRAP
jgi:hypothetical protein